MKILAVDDEKLALEALIDAIRSAIPDAQIRGFRSSEDAEEFILLQPCDIAFLDIEMRGKSGLDFARELKAIDPKLNIIFTTGYSDYTGEAFGLHASGYIMKPVTSEKIKKELDDLRYLVTEGETHDLRIQTFGNFEIYYKHSPVKFQYSKTKELLAYLVDRRGALCSNGELIAVLWGDDGTEKKKGSYLQNLKADLSKTLDAIGCSNVIVRHRGGFGLCISSFDCDYYDWLDGKPEAIKAYHGEYMAQYSWSETTEGSLVKGD